MAKSLLRALAAILRARFPGWGVAASALILVVLGESMVPDMTQMLSYF